MKKIYPVKEDNIATLAATNEKPVTQQQYEDLVNRTNTAVSCAESVDSKLTNLQSELADGLTTNCVVASNTTTDSLVSAEATVTDLTSTNSTTDNLTATCATVTNIQAEQIGVSSVLATECAVVNTRLAACDVIADTITANNITTPELNIADSTITNLTAINAIVTEAAIDNAEVDKAAIEEARVDSLQASEANIDKAEVEEATITAATVTKADIKFITHIKLPQVLNQNGDFFIVPPFFTNGVYLLEARNDDGTKLFSIELRNSQNNVWFSWSENDDFLSKVDFFSQDGMQGVQIAGNTLNQNITLYAASVSTDNEEPPTIYSSAQYEGEKTFNITATKGTYIPNSVFAGQFHAESMLIDDVVFDRIFVDNEINLPRTRDVVGAVTTYSSGSKGDYISVNEWTDTNGTKHTEPKWTTPADKVERNNEKLITSDAVSDYTGQIDNPDYDGDNEQYLYPLTNLGNNTLVHGNEIIEDSLTVQEDIRNDMLFSGAPLTSDIAALTDGAIVIDSATNQAYVKVTEDDEAVIYPLTANDGNLSNNKPVVWDSEHGYLKSADDLNIDSLSVDVLNANTAYIKKLSTVEEETLLSTGDYTVLRANNPSGLSSTDYSGLLIHNYNGESNDLALVADSDGTLRVGTGTPTDVTYANLYFSNNKWYSDETLETEVTPAGSLTSWDSVETTDDYKHYTNAVFSVITYDTLQPLLTRDEEENLTDQGLLKYNTSSHKADTITVPTNTSTLVYQEGKTDTCWVGYGWSFRPANGCAWNYYTCTTDITSCVEAGCYDMHQGLCDSQSIDILYNQNGCSRGFTHTSCMCILIPRQNFCSIYISDGEKHLEFHPTELYCWHHVNVTTCTSLPGTLVNVYTGCIDNWGCIAHQGWSYDYCTQEAGYKWCDIQPGVYCYASMACYKAADTSDIPEGSIVIIGDECNYLKGDDK